MYANKNAHKIDLAKYDIAVLKYHEDIALWGAEEEPDDAKKPVEPIKPEYVPLDIVEFWRAHKASFRIVAQVARWVLVIAISSAEVERLFSRGGLVLTSRRNRLGEAKEELLLLTAYNMTREWKEAGSSAGCEEEIIMRRLFGLCDGGLDIDEMPPE